MYGRLRHFDSDPWLDLPPAADAGPYPYEGFAGREADIITLSRLLDPRSNIGGSTVLISGLRGAGKTSMVNRAIFHAAMSGRFQLDGAQHAMAEQTVIDEHGLLTSDGWRAWKQWPPSSKANLKKLGYAKNRIKQPFFTAQKDPFVFLNVYVPVPDAAKIEARDLLCRTVGRLYHRLVETGMADANPNFVRSVRIAHLRSMADKTTTKESIKEKFLVSFEAGIKSGKNYAGIAAKQELELALEIAAEFARSDTLTLTEDLSRILQDLSTLRFGQETVARRAVDAIKASFGNLDAWLCGDNVLRIHPIVVYDELDKAFVPDDVRDSSSDDAVSSSMLESTATLASHSFTRFFRVLSNLKTVLTASQVSYVFVCDETVAEQWSRPDCPEGDIIRSICPQRFHVGLLSENEVRSVLRDYINGTDGDVPVDLAQAATFVSSGRYRSLVRLIRESGLMTQIEPEREPSLRAHKLAETLAGSSRFTIPELARSHTVVAEEVTAMLEELETSQLPNEMNRVFGRSEAVSDVLYVALRDMFFQLWEALRELRDYAHFGRNADHERTIVNRHLVVMNTRSSLERLLAWFPREQESSTRLVIRIMQDLTRMLRTEAQNLPREPPSSSPNFHDVSGAFDILDALLSEQRRESIQP